MFIAWEINEIKETVKSLFDFLDHGQHFNIVTEEDIDFWTFCLERSLNGAGISHEYFPHSQYQETWKFNANGDKGDNTKYYTAKPSWG